MGTTDNLTKTEAQNIEIMGECQSDIEKAIKQYYTNIGKKNYQFNLQEEINKINQMTDEEYRHFANVLHSKEAVKKSPESQTQKIAEQFNRPPRSEKKIFKK